MKSEHDGHEWVERELHNGRIVVACGRCDLLKVEDGDMSRFPCKPYRVFRTNREGVGEAGMHSK